MSVAEHAPAVRPKQVSVAFWLQLAVISLLVVMAAVGAAGALLLIWLLGDFSPGFEGPIRWLTILTALLLLLAGWLTAGAVGLRRRSRAGYWCSLAGLLLPLLAVVAVLGFWSGTEYRFAEVASADPQEADRLTGYIDLFSTVLSTIGGLGAVVAVVLLGVGAGMLLTARSHEYFTTSLPT